MHTYIHAYIQPYIHTTIHIYRHTYIHTCIHPSSPEVVHEGGECEEHFIDTGGLPQSEDEEDVDHITLS